MLAEESLQFFTENPPVLSLSEIGFRVTELEKYGINAENETINYRASVLMNLYNRSAYKVETDLSDGMSASLPGESQRFIPEQDSAGYHIWEKLYALQTVLVNGNGKIISTSPMPPETLRLYDGNRGGLLWEHSSWNGNLEAVIPYIAFFGSRFSANGGIYYVNGSRSRAFGLYWQHDGENGGTSPFETGWVSINDITDAGMSLRITKVYEYGLKNGFALKEGRGNKEYTTAVLLRIIDIP
ncbi:hypothetical protein AGMMS50255_2810 [Spirochaetia bacterium]|nr:hypothetical protein AGMMS50255_2810 [Spirochaetia bacterium]